MVRETRHLWVGNLPNAIREERILDHFKRYGKVQSVKILPKKDEEAGGGACATVAFIDIKSAAKAHNAENKIEERTLKTDYYEPPASSTASSAIFFHERDDALVGRSPVPPPPPAPYATGRNSRYGLPEDRNYERPGHYYERVADRESYLRRPIGMGYHDEDNYQGRAKSRDRYVRSTSGNSYTENSERGQNHFRAHNTRQHFEQTRYSEQYNDERDVTSTTPRVNRRTNNASGTSVVSSVASSPAPPSTQPTGRSESRPRRTKRRSPSNSPSGSRSNSVSRSRSRSTSGSRSSSSSSKLRSSSSNSSGRSLSPSKSRSPVAPYGSQSNAKGSRLDRPASAIANPSNSSLYLPSSVSSTINCTSVNSQGSLAIQGSIPVTNENAVDNNEKKPLGICVRNLPVRSTDTSLKDGLFHEYKKHGKVTMVKVIGQAMDRYAVVCFKKPEDVEKALEVSKDKLFFGCKIEVTAHEGLDADDNEFRPLEAELDEFHPKATRTLFIGNLEKDITTAELRKHFDQFGEIIEIDIKKQGSATSYAFIQYSDIGSVVKAMRKLDGENLGANRIKLGFGKSMPTNCVWLDGIVDAISEKFLARHFNRFGLVAYCAIDREKGHALVFYDSVEFAQIAVAEMRGRILGGKKLQVDFASRECQTTFFDKLEMTGQIVQSERPWERRERRAGEFEILRGDDRDTRVGFENRMYTRYEGQTRATRGSFRGIQRTSFSGRGRGQAFPARYEMFYDEFGERRHRYASREESSIENLPFDPKTERLKYVEPVDCANRKRNKLRNSISDQESHHSQSPPHSRHESRSTSPVSKDRKSLKDRIHHRIKSPGSHNSSQVGSPCRESANEEQMEISSDYKEYRIKCSDGKADISDSDISFPLASPKNSMLYDAADKLYPKIDDCCRRRSIDSDNLDENSSASEQSNQLERKRRLLASSASGSLGKDAGFMISKSPGDRLKHKTSVCHSGNKLGQMNCVSHGVCDEKSDTENNEHEESVKEKLRPGESANSDLKYLQKKQVHILHLLEQLHEGVNSSDTDGSIDGERYSRKKQRSLSSCVENMYSEKDISKAITKDEFNSKSIKNAVKDQISRCISKTENVDSNNCYSLSLDSFAFRKHLDPRKGGDHQTLTSVSSLQKCRRISIDREDLFIANSQASGDSFVCVPASVTSDLTWKKQCNAVGDTLQSIRGTDELSSVAHSKVKDEVIDGDVCITGKNVFSTQSSLSSDISKTFGTMRAFSDSCHEVKRERDVSPLSLPLPKFAASLKSPKSSPIIMTSPRSVGQSPRGVHSPTSFISSKSVKHIETLQDIHNERKAKDTCLEEKLNGINISSSSTMSSPSESQLHSEISDFISCLEPIQSPKSTSDRNRDCVIASSDSDLSPASSPNRPSIEDRIKALDEKFNAWSGSSKTANSNAVPETPPPTVTELPKCNIKKRSRFTFLTPEIRTEPSDIVKSLLAKSTIFDQDSMRLQHIDEKYEPVSNKIDPSQKTKPTFRTKAAAKEFSSHIASALPTFNTPVLAKTPSALPTPVISSPPDADKSQSAMSNNSVLSPITPPTPHYSQMTSQIFTPCSPRSPRVASFPSSNITKEMDDVAFSVHKDVPGDQAGLTPKVYSSLKIKTEPVIGAVSPIEVLSHGLLTNSLPVSVKKEPLTLKENIQLFNDLTETTFNNSNKKELSSVLKVSIPPGKDYAVTLLKDQMLYKNVNPVDHNRKELMEQHSVLRDSCTQWKDLEKIDEMVDAVAKTLPNLESSELKHVSPATKKRVSSIDSNESESGKSCKSLESISEGHDLNWIKQEKPEMKLQEPECKKAKLTLPKNERERSPTPVPPAVVKKSEKKEKVVKHEKTKVNNPKINMLASFDKEVENKNTGVKGDVKEKLKSETHRSRDEKKKSREHKDGSVKSEQRKSCERRNSEKDSKNTSSGKSKKEHSENKTEKSKNDKKTTEKKQSSSKSKPKQSILDFEIPLDDEPVYFSMYDKVKARSSKTQTLKHQAKDLETMRQKFSKLKQSRAKREEKSKSADHDSDRDTDSTSDNSSDSEAQTKAKTKQHRKRKLVIESSSDEEAFQDSQSKANKNEQSYDSDSDSEFEQRLHQKQNNLQSNRSRKKKRDVIESDSSDSTFQPSSVKLQTAIRKKQKLKTSQDKIKKFMKSDNETSDFEIGSKLQVKDKDHKRKKAKRFKGHENKHEKEFVDVSQKKVSEEPKNQRKKSHKEEKQHSDNTSGKVEEYNWEKAQNAFPKERKTSNDTEQGDIEEFGKLKLLSKKKKKSKKTSRSKEKRAASDKRSSEFTNKKDDESESKSSLPVLMSPRPNSPMTDKPLSPPCLQVGDAVEDIKLDLDFPKLEFENNSHRDSRIASSEWKHRTVKTETFVDKLKNSKKKERDILSSEQPAMVELEHNSSLYCEKISKTSVNKELLNRGNLHNDSTRKKPTTNAKKGKESSSESVYHKIKHEKGAESNYKKTEEEKSFGESGSHMKDEKRKKKLKKQSKEKKPKAKDDDTVKVKDNFSELITSLKAVSPPIFESVSLDSRLSDVHLDEEIAEETRRLEEELLAASEETNVFSTDVPTIKKEPVERKFEEEAAKETKRLEAELFSTGHESWHMKDKPFGPELHSEVTDNKQVENSSLSDKEENIFANLNLHTSSIGDTSQHGSDIFLPEPTDSEQYKLDDKDGGSEIDDQRKIEDDLAVSALLQEMNSGEIPAPELTKETDFLEPLISTQPDDTLNYLLTDECGNSLPDVDNSPDLLISESQEAGLDSESMVLSPSSNSEPPALEISNFEDTLKNYHDAKTAQEVVTQVDAICNSSINKHGESKQAGDSECAVKLTDEIAKSKPPVIDIPSGIGLEIASSGLSPRSGKRSERKRWLEKSPRLAKELQLGSEGSEKAGSFQSKASPGDFEDITMDISDSKDDDTPPVLLPVDLPMQVPPVNDSATRNVPESLLVHRNENVPTSESVIVCVPDKYSRTNLPVTHVKETAKSVPLNLADYEDSCSGLAPLSIVDFCQEDETKSSEESGLSDISRDNFKSRNDVQLSNSFDKNNRIDNLKDWKSSLSEVRDIIDSKAASEKDKTANIPSVLVTESHTINYSDTLKNMSVGSDNYGMKNHDTSVIKSTASVVTSHSSFTEHPCKFEPENDEYEPHVITTDSFLYNVFGTSKDTPSLMIINTSHLLSHSNNPVVKESKEPFNMDPNKSVSIKEKELAKTLEKKEPAKQQEITTSKISMSVSNKDMIDTSLHEPLHFPPLFTIPTQPLFSPKAEKSSEAKENTSANVCAEDSENTHDLRNDEPKSVVNENKNNQSSLNLAEDVFSESTSDAPLDTEQAEICPGSLAETLSKMEAKAEGDNVSKNSKSADVESVSSDTTDIAFSDIKTDFEMNQLTSSEEQIQDDVCAPEEPVIKEKPKPTRTRRGRRARTRKHAETAASTSKLECSNDAPPNPPTTRSNKRARPVAERSNRRSLRSEACEIIESKEVPAEVKQTLVANDILNDTKKLGSENLKFNDSPVSVIEKVMPSNDASNLHLAADAKIAEKAYNTRSEDSRKRRGRKKKLSTECQQTVIANDKTEAKTEDVDHSKELHKPKGSRLWLSLPSEKEPKSLKENSSAFDVFEFCEEEEEEVNRVKDFASSVKERLHDSSKHSSISAPHEVKVDAKHADVQKVEKPEVEKPVEKEKKTDEVKPKMPVVDEHDFSTKEYVTEVNQHKKTCITIRRLHQKDGHDGASAEVVKTTETPIPEEPKAVETSKADKTIASKEPASTELTQNGPSKSTRKSTRLMNQAARSTVDDVIEDVVKGNFKASSSANGEPVPSRVTRRSRANRKSEESMQVSAATVNVGAVEDVVEDKNKSEPMFVILDNTVKDVNECKKSIVSQQCVDIPQVSEASSSSESEKNSDRIASLRSYRITRSSANKMDAQKEIAITSSSEASHDCDITKKETFAVRPMEDKEEHQSKDHSKRTSTAGESRCHPPLQDVKIELPRVTMKLEKNDESEDDSDSRSSPTALIDPSTGFLTPVNKKGEPILEQHDNSKTSTVPCSEGKVAVCQAVAGVPASSEPLVTTTKVSTTELPHTLKEENVHSSLSTKGEQPSVGMPAFPSISFASSVSNISQPVVTPKKEIPAASSVCSLSSELSSLVSSNNISAVDRNKESKSISASLQACTHVGVLTSVVSSPGLSSGAASKVSSTKRIPPEGVNLQSEHVNATPVPLVQPSRTLSAHQQLPSAAVITSNQSTMASPHNLHTHQSSRTIVTAVVTLSSTDTSAKVPPKIQTKGLAGSHVLGFGMDGLTPLKPDVRGNFPVTSSGRIANTSVTYSKAATIDPMANSQHWNLLAEKDILSSLPAGLNNSGWASKSVHGNKIPVTSDLPRLLSANQNIPSHSPMSNKSESRIAHTGKVGHSHAPKSGAYLQQPVFPTSAYDASVHASLCGLASGNSSGVIAELLQNPQLLQQHKDYLNAAAVAAASSTQYQERNQGQVRPLTPVASGIPPEVAARLGNPTPPHTPTPPVTSSGHSLQSSDIHGAHVGAHPMTPLQLRHSAQPLIGPPGIGIHPAFVQQIIYPPDLYAARHDIRVQQEAQARAAAIGLADPFAYSAIPSASSPSSFRQPLEPRLPHSSDAKLDPKSVAEMTNHIRDGRSRTPDDKAHHQMKPIRIKKDEKELKMVHSDDHHELSRPGSAHEKHPSMSAVTPQSLRHNAYYPSTIRQVSPHLNISPHERITDSPVISNIHPGAQGRIPPIPIVDALKDQKIDGALSLHQSHHTKGDSSKRDIKPPVAHQAHPSTVPYHSLDASVHPATRQQLLGVPHVGSPASGYIDGHPSNPNTHSPSTLSYKKDSHHLQNAPSSDKRTNQDVSKKPHVRSLGHQGSPSPGLVTSHSPLPCSPVIQSHHTIGQPTHVMGEQFGHRTHHAPHMGSDVPVPTPPPAHAMSQPTSIPRTLPQTPPQASQVPPHNEAVMHKYPVMWQGYLALKNDQALVQMHFVSGNPDVAKASLPTMIDGETAPVRIAQRMRLEPTQLDGVTRKMQMTEEHCILMAFPCGKDEEDVELQSNNLRNGFINYLQQKCAAGIVNAAAPGSQQPAFVIHIFPSCNFSESSLKRIAPDLSHIINEITHLVIIIATV